MTTPETNRYRGYDGRGFLQLLANFTGFEGQSETSAVLWECQ